MLLITILIKCVGGLSNMRPLYVLLNWLDKYRIGTKNEPLHNPTQVSEFKKLNEAAIRYAERSERCLNSKSNLLVMLLTRCKLHFLSVSIVWKC